MIKPRDQPSRDVCLLGLLGLRIVEATGANITYLGEETATASSVSSAKGARPSSSHRLRSGDW